MQKEYLFVIAKLLKAKSVDLHDHSVLTAEILQTLVSSAQAQHYTLSLPPEAAKAIGLLHDIGKVYINDVIYHKQDSLSPREWETIQLHPTWSKQFVTGMVFEEYGDILIQHHEKSDGTGYPNKLKGSSIHDISHMLSIADQMASLMENRPYKRSIEDKQTLLSIIRPNVKLVFGAKTESIFSQTIDEILISRNEPAQSLNENYKNRQYSGPLSMCSI